MSDLIYECACISKEIGCECRVMGADMLTTFKGGGKACVFYPDSEESFVNVYNTLAQRFEKPFILGGGSNTVIADGLCKVPVISTKKLNGVHVEAGKVYAGCGAYINDVMRTLRRYGLGGFEFLSGVPATVGGAVRMNASAFTAQTADYIDEIMILTSDCEENGKYKPKTVKRSDLNLTYRHGVADIILSAVFDAEIIDGTASKERAERYLKERAGKQPRYPSCGSVFKNGDMPSGKLIDECGLKGVSSGGAQISEMHGNFIVNRGGATANDFMSLVRLAENRVFDKFGVRLLREFVYLE